MELEIIKENDDGKCCECDGPCPKGWYFCGVCEDKWLSKER